MKTVAERKHELLVAWFSVVLKYMAPTVAQVLGAEDRCREQAEREAAQRCEFCGKGFAIMKPLGQSHNECEYEAELLFAEAEAQRGYWFA